MKGDKIRKKILKLNVKKKNPKILDIGCGLGDSLQYIENPIYFGYDISKTYIEYAKKNIKKVSAEHIINHLFPTHGLA